jgi:hypothetical protein
MACTLVELKPNTKISIDVKYVRSEKNIVNYGIQGSSILCFSYALSENKNISPRYVLSEVTLCN